MAHDDYQHRQEWVLTIHPDEGETWPRAEVPGRRGGQFQPLTISFYATAGGSPRIGLLGVRIRQDGTPGKLRAGSHRPLPGWAAGLLDEHRELRGLTDAYLREQGVKIEGGNRDG